MGKRYEQHSDLCGCERCARQADRENPQPVFDVIEDPNVLDCGCSVWGGCRCHDYDPGDDEMDAAPAAWFASICALVKGETPISMEHAA